MMSTRLPEGGFDEVIRLSYTDVVLNVYKPVFAQASSEFPPALAELRQRFGIGDVPLGLIGGSAGAAVAQLVALESGVTARALVLISPVVDMRTMVDAESASYGITYEWSTEALETARRIDFAARAGEFAAKDPAVLIAVGADDSPKAFVEPAHRLHEALQSAYTDPARIALREIQGMGHAFAEQPGEEPAPQIPAALALDGLATEWLHRWL
jgi:acetyl esterase/lipase